MLYTLLIVLSNHPDYTEWQTLGVCGRTVHKSHPIRHEEVCWSHLEDAQENFFHAGVSSRTQPLSGNPLRLRTHFLVTTHLQT